MTALPSPIDAFEEAIDDYLAAPIDDETLELDPTNIPLDDGRASALLRRRSRVQANLSTRIATAQLEIDRLNEYINDCEQMAERELSWIERALESYMRVRFLRTREKTLSTPNGKLKLSKPRSRSIIDDRAALIAWCKAHRPELVITEERVNVSDVTKVGQAVSADESIETPDRGEVGRYSLAVVIDAEAGEIEHVPGVHLELPTADKFGIEA